MHKSGSVAASDYTASPADEERARPEILGEPVDPVSKDQGVEWVIERALRGDPGAYVCLTNVHTTIESRNMPALRDSARQAFLSVPDGMPLVWILRRRGYRATEKLTGVEYMPLLAQAGRDRKIRHYLYGGAPGVAARAGKALEKLAPGSVVVGASAPPFAAEWPLDDLQRELEETRPHIMWVGLGAPKQEMWMPEVAGRLNVPVMIGVGAAFDFLAGTKRPAPAFARHIGLEWLFRLLSEPRRLWRRYLVYNSKFVYLLAREAMRSRRSS